VNPWDFLIMAFWMILILLSIFLVGFLIALPIWIFSYVRLRGKRPWRYAFLTAIIVWCFVYGFFVKIMGAELFKGLLFGDML
jgi:Kef-type K+ transport system membrane component KefB